MEDENYYTLSAHAVAVMAERNIPVDWVNRVLRFPDQVIVDRVDPELLHAVGRVPEYNDRILRVVYNVTVNPWRVVTVYFDRGLRGKL